MRIVGSRKIRPVGLRGPTADEIQASIEAAEMAPRVIPKGVYRYASHEEANAEMDRWIAEGMVKTISGRFRDPEDGTGDARLEGTAASEAGDPRSSIPSDAWTSNALEDAVLDLYEAESAGIERGDLDYHLVSVPRGDIEGLTGRGVAESEAFLAQAIEDAKGMGGHWEAMLEGEMSMDGFPPVIVFREDGPEIVDGEHRLAGMVLHPMDRVDLVVGVVAGASLADCFPTAREWTVLSVEAATEAPRPG